MQKILVSACLVGEGVRYDGGHSRSPHPLISRWADEGRLVAVCPEVLGSLPVPRPASEIQQRVPLRIVTADGVDVTPAFEKGAALAASTALACGIRVAILKEGSPSCGTTRVHDGRFTGRSIPGSGVTAARLSARGIRVFSDAEIDLAAEYLAQTENDSRS